jgi:hypothetical protein
MLSLGSEDAEQGNNSSGGTQQTTNEAKSDRGSVVALDYHGVKPLHGPLIQQMRPGLDKHLSQLCNPATKRSAIPPF